VILMGLAGPEDAISVPLLSNLYLDKTIRFSLLYPLQWPKTIRILEDRKIDTGKIITHSATIEGIAPAIERVLNRDDAVIKTVITPS
jgi:threonine dehydrogenase-like Zn-dependent dehydrogenase